MLGVALLFAFMSITANANETPVVCNAACCPERENDFVWENDKFGMRAYGPGEFHKWSGFDVFNKGKGAGSAVEMMRHPKACGNWHAVPWKGVLDNYTMGASRGVGGIAMFADGEWKTFPDWESHRIIHTGDDYLEFELVYPAFSAAGKMTCRITLRKGERFFRNDVSFERMRKDFLVGPGLDLAPERGHVGNLRETATSVSLFEKAKPVQEGGGVTMSALFVSPDAEVVPMTDAQKCRVIAFRGQRTFTYWAGASWSAAGEIVTAEDWHGLVQRFQQEVAQPKEAKPLQKSLLSSAISFLRLLPQMIETCAEDPELAYYGTGESGHWAVQCSQQVMAALAILSERSAEELAAAGCPLKQEEMRELALKLLRYSLRTHVTGDIACTDGKKWGHTWISVLGLERSSGGVQLLDKYLTDDDRRRLKALMVHESDFRLKDYEIVAGISANNKPESNIWNASVMLRTAAMYPDLPQAGAYVEKAKKMLLNALTVPSDAKYDWYVGSNFTENWALDHHGYLNVGYMYECFSNLAFLHFWYKARGERPPEESLHHVADLWKVCKTLTFPDGRLCRIGGDTRARWAYCQVFAVQAWIYLAGVLGDGTASAFERAYFSRLFKEQATNLDGSYFGNRLADVRAHSRYYYCRLEADAFFTTAYALLWHAGSPEVRPVPLAVEGKGETWSERYHGAVFLRTPSSYRSSVFRSQGGISQRGRGPNILCVPAADSSLADWSGNLLGRIGLNAESDWWDGAPDAWPTNFLTQSCFEDDWGKGFVQRFAAPVREAKVFGEGQQRDVRVGTRQVAVVAVSDGATLAVRECVTFEKSTSLPSGYDALHLMIPNDVQNAFRRRYCGRGFALDASSPPARDEILETGSRVLTVDDRLSVVAVCGDDLKLKRTMKPATVFSHSFFPQPLASERADEICMNCRFEPCYAVRGQTLYDVAYLVSACDGKTAARMADSVSWDKTSGRLKFTGADGNEREVTLK